MRLFKALISSYQFWENTKVNGECVEWKGPYGRGYGLVNVYVPGKKRKTRLPAHRVAYYLTHGAFPYDLHVCHSCDNRKCVYPKHLWLGTAKDNMQDRENKRRGRNSRKTHCHKGHEFNLVNTRYSKYNQRICRICDKIRQRRKRTAKE